MSRIIQLSEFSKYPGGRFRSDGPANGEEFRDDVLVPALKSTSKVVVVLDGVNGLPRLFLKKFLEA